MQVQTPPTDTQEPPYNHLAWCGITNTHAADIKARTEHWNRRNPLQPLEHELIVECTDVLLADRAPTMEDMFKTATDLRRFLAKRTAMISESLTSSIFDRDSVFDFCMNTTGIDALDFPLRINTASYQTLVDAVAGDFLAILGIATFTSIAAGRIYRVASRLAQENGVERLGIWHEKLRLACKSTSHLGSYLARPSKSCWEREPILVAALKLAFPPEDATRIAEAMMRAWEGFEAVAALDLPAVSNISQLKHVSQTDFIAPSAPPRIADYILGIPLELSALSDLKRRMRDSNNARFFAPEQLFRLKDIDRLDIYKCQFVFSCVERMTEDVSDPQSNIDDHIVSLGLTLFESVMTTSGVRADGDKASDKSEAIERVLELLIEKIALVAVFLKRYNDERQRASEKLDSYVFNLVMLWLHRPRSRNVDFASIDKVTGWLEMLWADKPKRDAFVGILEDMDQIKSPSSLQTKSEESPVDYDAGGLNTLMRGVHLMADAAPPHTPLADDKAPSSTPKTKAGKEQKASTVIVIRGDVHLSSFHIERHPHLKAISEIAGIELPLQTIKNQDMHNAEDQLSHEFPYAADVVRTIMRRVRGNQPILFQPLLLVGPPGSGKTRLASRIGEVLLMHPTLYNAGGNMDSSIGGTNKQYDSQRISIPLQAIVRSKIANPLVVVDEIDKAVRHSKNGSFYAAVLPFLERESAGRYLDPALEVPTDLSRVNWIATANSTSHLPAEILSRFHLISVPLPGAEHVFQLANSIAWSMQEKYPGSENGLLDAEFTMLTKAWRGGSLRALQRMVETILISRDNFNLGGVFN